MTWPRAAGKPSCTAERRAQVDFTGWQATPLPRLPQLNLVCQSSGSANLPVLVPYPGSGPPRLLSGPADLLCRV